MMCEHEFKVYAGDTVQFWKQRAMMLDTVASKQAKQLADAKTERDEREVYWETHYRLLAKSMSEKIEQAEAQIRAYSRETEKLLTEKIESAKKLQRMEGALESINNFEGLPCGLIDKGAIALHKIAKAALEVTNDE
jgi:hypothetical protein